MRQLSATVPWGLRAVNRFSVRLSCLRWPHSSACQPADTLPDSKPTSVPSLRVSQGCQPAFGPDGERTTCQFRLQPTFFFEFANSTSANVNFGHLDFGNFLMLLDHKEWGPEGWRPKPRTSGGPEGWSPEGWGPTFRIFSLSRRHFFPACLLILVVLQTRALKCAIWASGPPGLHNSPRTPSVHTWRFKHHLNERTNKSGEKNGNCGGRGKKRAKFWRGQRRGQLGGGVQRRDLHNTHQTPTQTHTNTQHCTTTHNINNNTTTTTTTQQHNNNTTTTQQHNNNTQQHTTTHNNTQHRRCKYGPKPASWPKSKAEVELAEVEHPRLMATFLATSELSRLNLSTGPWRTLRTAPATGASG